MDHGTLALMIPIIGLSIPVVAILSTTAQRMYEMRLKTMNGTDKGTADQLNKRIAELEQRVLTLQDLVIGGDYDVRRRLDHAMSQQPHGTSTHPIGSSQPHTVPPSASHSVAEG